MRTSLGVAFIALGTAACGPTEAELYLLDFERTQDRVEPDEDQTTKVVKTDADVIVVEGIADVSSCSVLGGDTRWSIPSVIILRVHLVPAENRGRTCPAEAFVSRYTATIAKAGAAPWRVKVFRHTFRTGAPDVLALDTVLVN